MHMDKKTIPFMHFTSDKIIQLDWNQKNEWERERNNLMEDYFHFNSLAIKVLQSKF
jgi:hypothetical protein